MQNNNNPLIFIVEDNPIYNDLIIGALKKKQFRNLRSFKSAEECSQLIHLNPDIIVLDYTFSGFTGMDLMKKVHESKPWVTFIFLSGQNSVEVAVKVIRYGAFDYIVRNEKAIDNLVAAVEIATKIEKKKRIRKGLRKGAILFFVIAIILILLIFSLSLFFDEFKLF